MANPIYTIITHLTEASWEFIVISMSNWIHSYRASHVLWSTGSINWMLMLLIITCLKAIQIYFTPSGFHPIQTLMYDNSSRILQGNITCK